MFSQKKIKRVVDIVGATILLLLLFPVFVPLYLIILITMGRPVFFKQYRPGKNEVLFPILKFRTMSQACSVDGTPLPDKQRLTKLGTFLRKTSLDELPSLLNVIKGEMSFVGPRPLLTQYLPYYTDEERIRFSMRPGITGLAQVSGRNNLEWNSRLSMDVDYVRTYSLILDIIILFKTVLHVFTGKDIAVDTDTVETFLDEERATSDRAN